MRILNAYAMRDELSEELLSYSMVLPHFSKNRMTLEIYEMYMKHVQTASLLSQNKIYDSI